MYTDPAGFGGIINTFKEADKLEPTVTIDVRNWIEKKTHRMTNLSGFNSYVAPRPDYEYHIGVFLMSDAKGRSNRSSRLLCVPYILAPAA